MVGATTCLGLPDIQFVLMDEAATSAGHRPGDLPRPRDLEHLVHANAEDLGKLVGGDDAPHCETLLVVFRLAATVAVARRQSSFEIPILHRDGQMPAPDDRNRGQAVARAASGLRILHDRYQRGNGRDRVPGGRAPHCRKGHLKRVA
jgi:hypothetical protein